MQHYPKWIIDREGTSRIVPNQKQHRAFVDYEVNEKGERVDAAPVAESMVSIDPTLPYPSAEPVADDSPRFLKIYPCGCSAGPGPASLPDYCPDHGNYAETEEAITVPYEETGAAVSAVPEILDEAGLFS